MIIGITGTAGKTSTLNAVHAALKDFRQVKTGFKVNSESGLPLHILGLNISNFTIAEWFSYIFLAPYKLLTNWEKYDTYIAEMAIDSPNPPKNMSYLLTILKPQVGVFLNARPMHSLQFDPLVSETDPEKRAAAVTKAIADEKGKLIVSLPKTGTAVLNADDSNVIAFAKKTQAKVISFGTDKAADIRVSEVRQNLDGTTVSLEYKKSKHQLHFPDYVLPGHFGLTLAAALATAASLGIDFAKAAKALEKNYRVPKGRSTLIQAINGAYIIDSSYNSSTAPAIDSLDMLDSLAKGRKLALLGDMRELGMEAAGEHQKVAHHAANICDQVILVGPLMKEYGLPIIEESGTPVKWFPSAQKAAEYLKNELKKDDVLLVKGSQNTLLLEIAVEALMKNPELAHDLLCRRGAYWDKQRRALFS